MEFTRVRRKKNMEKKSTMPKVFFPSNKHEAEIMVKVIDNLLETDYGEKKQTNKDEGGV